MSPTFPWTFSSVTAFVATSSISLDKIDQLSCSTQSQLSHSIPQSTFMPHATMSLAAPCSINAGLETPAAPGESPLRWIEIVRLRNVGRARKFPTLDSKNASLLWLRLSYFRIDDPTTSLHKMWSMHIIWSTRIGGPKFSRSNISRSRHEPTFTPTSATSECYVNPNNMLNMSRQRFVSSNLA
jgi:hypothetical protein